MHHGRVFNAESKRFHEKSMTLIFLALRCYFIAEDTMHVEIVGEYDGKEWPDAPKHEAQCRLGRSGVENSNRRRREIRIAANKKADERTGEDAHAERM